MIKFLKNLFCVESKKTEENANISMLMALAMMNGFNRL